MARLRLVFIVGEPSGDTLAAEMIDGLKAAGHNLELSGVGGTKMLSRGLVSVEPMESLTIIGLVEALRAVPRLSRLADRLVDHVLETKPDAVITVDSKGFNLRFARRLRQKMAASGPYAAPVIHVVAPTVWAWASWRAKTVARSIDRLLCLYPFEIPYFRKYGLDTVSIGHPAADRTRKTYKVARSQLGVADGDKMLVLLPGSRRREVMRLLPDMVAAVSILKEQVPSLKVFLPVANSVSALIDSMIAGQNSIKTVSSENLDTVLAAGDFGLICSGTVSLEAALNGLPGHVCYRSDRLTEIIGRMLVRMDRVVLPNVIAGREIYKFNLGRKFDATSMASSALNGLAEGRSGNMAADTIDLVKTLKSPEGFGHAAAKAILEKIKVKPRQ